MRRSARRRGRRTKRCGNERAPRAQGAPASPHAAAPCRTGAALPAHVVARTPPSALSCFGCRRPTAAAAPARARAATATPQWRARHSRHPHLLHLSAPDACPTRAEHALARTQLPASSTCLPLRLRPPAQLGSRCCARRHRRAAAGSRGRRHAASVFLCRRSFVRSRTSALRCRPPAARARRCLRTQWRACRPWRPQLPRLSAPDTRRARGRAGRTLARTQL